MGRKREIIIAGMVMFLLGGCGGADTAKSGAQNHAADTNQWESDTVTSKPVIPEKNTTEEKISDGYNSKPGDKEQEDGVQEESVNVPTARKVGWYLRTIAVAQKGDMRYVHNTAGVFGELSDSKDGKDPHDVASYGSATFQVRFLNPDIDPQGQYYSDYRAFHSEPRASSWTFVVQNGRVGPVPVNLADASLKIEVSDLYEVWKKEGSWRYIEQRAQDQSLKTQLTLVDMDHNRSYPYEALKDLTLSMDGNHTRMFKWVLNRSVKPSDYERNASVEQRALSRSMRGVQNRMLTHHGFGLPPR